MLCLSFCFHLFSLSLVSPSVGGWGRVVWGWGEDDSAPKVDPHYLTNRLIIAILLWKSFCCLVLFLLSLSSSSFASILCRSKWDLSKISLIRHTHCRVCVYICVCFPYSIHLRSGVPLCVHRSAPCLWISCVFSGGRAGKHTYVK